MLTLRQLEFAVAVADEGGFTAAARRCNTVQSALSHQVAKIEETFGARLFERGTRQVRPTAAGEVFLHNARQTLRAAERLHEEMAQALGTVRGRLALLHQFRSAHARVDVHLRTAMSEALLHDLGEGLLDVALVGVGPQLAVPAQRLLLHEEALALIVAPGHRFAARKRVALAELDDEPMAGLVPVPACAASSMLRLRRGACGNASSTKSPMPIWCANWSLPTWAWASSRRPWPRPCAAWSRWP